MQTVLKTKDGKDELSPEDLLTDSDKEEDDDIDEDDDSSSAVGPSGGVSSSNDSTPVSSSGIQHKKEHHNNQTETNHSGKEKNNITVERLQDSNRAMMSSQELSKLKKQEDNSHSSFKEGPQSSNAYSELNRSRASNHSKRPSHGQSSQGNKRRNQRRSTRDSEEMQDKVFEFEQRQMEAIIGQSTFKDNKALLNNKQQPHNQQQIPRDLQNRDLTDEGDSDTNIGRGVIDINELKENSEQQLHNPMYASDQQYESSVHTGTENPHDHADPETIYSPHELQPTAGIQVIINGANSQPKDDYGQPVQSSLDSGVLQNSALQNGVLENKI